MFRTSQQLLILLLLTGCSSIQPRPYDTSGDVIIRIKVNESQMKQIQNFQLKLLEEPRQVHSWEYSSAIKRWLDSPKNIKSNSAKQLDGYSIHLSPVDFKGARDNFTPGVGTPIIGIHIIGECEMTWILSFDKDNKVQEFIYDRKSDQYLETEDPSKDHSFIGHITSVSEKKPLKMEIDLNLSWNGNRTCDTPKRIAYLHKGRCTSNESINKPSSTMTCD